MSATPINCVVSCKEEDTLTVKPRTHDRECPVRKPRLQVLVYDILPPTTAIVDYAIGLEKLSANEQFFDYAEMAVTL